MSIAMNQTKIISRILYYLCTVLSAGYLITLVYSMVCLLTGFAITPYKDNMFLHINYPFTEQPFLNIERNCSYIIFSFLLVLISYGIFSGFQQRFSKYFFSQNCLQKKIYFSLRAFTCIIFSFRYRLLSSQVFLWKWKVSSGDWCLSTLCLEFSVCFLQISLSKDYICKTNKTYLYNADHSQLRCHASQAKNAE